MCTYCVNGCPYCNKRGHVPGGRVAPCGPCRNKIAAKEGVDPYPPEAEALGEGRE